ncbi:MAG: hypothetical protein OH335_04315 [Candidatus Parvarchaeota archaeon]|nr:hypothetical protein [Candidatus Jingweiarchaeum tengchongense]
MAKTYKFTTAPWKKPNAYQIEHLNSSCFLDPRTRTYPIKKSNDGPIYVHALVASAYYSSWNNPTVHVKAKNLLSIYAKSKDKSQSRKGVKK